MRRSQYTSKFSAVLLGSLLAVTFGSASQSARHLQDPVHGILPARAEKEPHETGGDLVSHVRSSGAASPKAEPVDAGDAESLRSHALHFGPHADVNFPNQIPLPRYFPGYFNKHNYAAVREAEPKHVDPADNQVKPPESGRPKRSTDSRMKDNKGDNGDHPLLDEPGAKVHCWNEANAFDVVLPASEVAKHFPHECQHPLSCNTTCVAKVPGRDVCARLKSECTVPETQLGTSQNENKQLASFEKNVERHLGELDAKLAQLSLESSNHKDKLVKLDHNLNRSSNAREEQFSAALVKILDSLDRKAAEMRSLFTEKNKQLASFEKNVERRLGELDAKLSQLSLESSNHKDKFVKLDHNMNRLSNARKEQFSAALVKILASLDRKAAEMKSLFNEKSESMMTTESSILSLIQSDSKTHLWTLKGYAALKADSIKHGQYSNWGPKVYIGRYLISWGITFVKRTDGVNLHLRVQLHKGINDEFLEWPFSNELKLSILHPESGEKQEGREKPQMVASDIKYYVRPIEVSNPGVYFSSIKFDASYLELSGYVKTDQLLLKLEMLS